MLNMCVNQRWIRNQYDHTKHYVKCGKCEACVQAKAIERTNRIDSEFNSGRVCLFATLSYADQFVPYIYKNEYQVFSDEIDAGHYDVTLNIYREFDRRRGNHDNYIVSKLYEPVKILNIQDFSYYGSIFVPSSKNFKLFKNLHKKRYGQDYFEWSKIGVLNYDDVRKFLMRVRRYLDYRKYDKRYEVFYVGEYGGDYSRPHFHVLFSIPQGDYELFKKAVLACWSFSDHERLEREVELARDPASYLASYVNSGSDLPSVLSAKTSPFRSVHKYSHGFGMSLGEFSYEAVKEAFYRGNFEYDVLTTRKGVTSFTSVPIPKYVINRYFPKFKGFSRLATDEILDVLHRPLSIHRYAAKANLSFEDCEKVVRLIRNVLNRPLCCQRGFDINEYLLIWSQSHNLHYANIFKKSFENIGIFEDFKYFYYNIGDFLRDRIKEKYVLREEAPDVLTRYQIVKLRCEIDYDTGEIIHKVPISYLGNFGVSFVAPTLDRLVFRDQDLLQIDPNKWPSTIKQHNKLVDAYKMYCKNREVSNQLNKVKYG